MGGMQWLVVAGSGLCFRKLLLAREEENGYRVQSRRPRGRQGGRVVRLSGTEGGGLGQARDVERWGVLKGIQEAKRAGFCVDIEDEEKGCLLALSLIP